MENPTVRRRPCFKVIYPIPRSNAPRWRPTPSVDGRSPMRRFEDMYPPPHEDEPWPIRAVLRPSDVVPGRVAVREVEMLGYLFRFWNADLTTFTACRGRVHLIARDLTDAAQQRTVRATAERAPCDFNYRVVFGESFDSLECVAGDMVCMRWDRDRDRRGLVFRIVRGLAVFCYYRLPDPDDDLVAHNL